MADDTRTLHYEPTPAEKKRISEIDALYDRLSLDRRVYEQQWFINAAFLRGRQYATWSLTENRLVVPPAPSHRVRLPVNRLLSKQRARLAKFLKERPTPIVIPATSDIEDVIDARATTKAIAYIWRKEQLELKYRDALLWASICGHGYWWLYWDPTREARLKVTDPASGVSRLESLPLGDVCVEVGSPFEVLVSDPGEPSLGRQAEIIRLKVRHIDDVRGRYPEAGQFVNPDMVAETALQFERQIATLTTAGTAGFGAIDQAPRTAEEKPSHVLVKEHFVRPSATYPHGRYTVVANGVLLKTQDELPYGFSQHPTNPFPVVDFVDLPQPGQYWNTTLVEQLIPLQREYNLIRSKISENLRMMVHPKLLAAKQHQIAPGAWTSDSGEMIEYVAIPNIPPPQPWHPPNIAPDAWQALSLLREEFEDISHIYPEAEGRVGSSKSGFQTNLLQEASETIHAPDQLAHRYAMEDAAFKLRQMMKNGYDQPRFLTILGKSAAPEAMEFGRDDIDEYADIVVQTGSILPDLKGARIQSVIELWKSGILGGAQDPEARRQAATMLEMGSIERVFDFAHQDEERARVEGNNFGEMKEVADPLFCDNHEIHYRFHTNQLKSGETDSWSPQALQGLLRHLVLHVRYINPQKAFEIAQEFGLTDVMQELLLRGQQAAAVQALQQGAVPPPGPPGPPPGPPAPPAAPVPAGPPMAMPMPVAG